MARSFSEEYKKSKNKLSDKIIEAIERGNEIYFCRIQ